LAASGGRPDPVAVDCAVEGHSAAARPRACRVVVFDSFEAAAEIRGLWGRLAETLKADLFGSFEWCEVWWRHFGKGRSLEIYCLWSGDELVGVWPLFRETLGIRPFSLVVVRLLGGDHAGTRCFPLVQESHLDDVVERLMASVEARGAWDVFHVGDLPGYYPAVEALTAALARSGAGRVHLSRDYYPHAVFPLASTFEQYLEGLSGNERNNIRKSERRLAKTHVLRSRLVPPAEREAFMRRLYDWHDAYWLSQHELGFFTLWPGARDFHVDVAALSGDGNGPVLIEVTANDEPVGAVCAHRYLGRLHLFQAVRSAGMQFESYGPGRLLHCETFRWCSEEAIATVDAMSGFYEYKRRLGAEFLGLTSMAVVRYGAGARVRTVMFKWAMRLIDAVYFRGWLCRVTPVLRRRFHRMKWKFLDAGMNERFIRSRFLLAALARPLGDGPTAGEGSVHE
jgi:CelD/BcsL family acetyltransferase involved in cellulose biosynthesis